MRLTQLLCVTTIVGFAPVPARVLQSHACLQLWACIMLLESYLRVLTLLYHCVVQGDSVAVIWCNITVLLEMDREWCAAGIRRLRWVGLERWSWGWGGCIDTIPLI